MFVNLINRIVELATGRVVDAVDTLEVQTDATNRIVEYGLDYGALAAEFDMSDLAGEIALSDLASEFDMCDLAREVVEDRDFREGVIDTIKESSAFERMVEDAVENHVDSIEARMQEVEAKVATLAAAPTPVANRTRSDTSITRSRRTRSEMTAAKGESTAAGSVRTRTIRPTAVGPPFSYA
jgi:hypothetical protein